MCVSLPKFVCKALGPNVAVIWDEASKEVINVK